MCIICSTNITTNIILTIYFFEQMRGSQRAPGWLKRVILLPESTKESGDDSDADPTFDPDKPQTSRLEQLLVSVFRN